MTPVGGRSVRARADGGRAARYRGAGDRRRRRPAARRRRVGLRLRRSPVPQHALLAGEPAGRARARVRRHRREGRTRGARDSAKATASSRRRRRTSAANACCAARGRYNLCPTRKGFGYGINGAMASIRESAGAMPARAFPIRCRSSWPASPSRTRWPTTRCASTRRSVLATPSSCWGPGRSACCARGWRRWPARIHLLSSGCRRTRRGCRQRGSLGATRVVNAQQESVDEVVRSFSPLGADLVLRRVWRKPSARRRARADCVPTARSPKSAGRRTWCRST